jgi:serine phosphatase RsbU (regulator of sigma subunit)
VKPKRQIESFLHGIKGTPAPEAFVGGHFEAVNKNAQPLTDSRMRKLIDEYYGLRSSDLQGSLEGLLDLVKHSTDTTDEDLSFLLLNRYAEVLMIAGHHKQAESIGQRVLNYFSASDNMYERARALYTLGSVEYKSMRHFDGMQKLVKAKRLFEEQQKIRELSRTIKAIAHIHSLFGNDDQALVLYEQCISMSRKSADMLGVSNANLGAATILTRRERTEEAEELILESINIKTRAGDKRGMAWAYMEQARLLLSRNRQTEAQDFALQSLAIMEEMGEEYGLARILNILGLCKLKQRAFSESSRYFEAAIAKSKCLECADQMIVSCDHLYQISKHIGDFQKALFYHEELLKYRENQFDQENTAQVKQIRSRFEEEYTRQQRQMEAERIEELRDLSRRLSEKNKNITDSLRYACRIQRAVLPETGRFRTFFRDYFIYYKPRDIVSGDFYWLGEHERKIFVAVGDCTGHGVPAAFLSLIGNDLLNEIVIREQIFRPAQVLHFMRSKMVKHLRQDAENEDNGTDGIAISTICIDKENLLLEFSGSFQPIYIVRGMQLFVLSPDKFYVGGYAPNPSEVFENKTFQLEEGDTIYMQTDGLKDQFGGAKNKKLKTDGYLNLIANVSGERLKKQHETISRFMDNWRGENPQVDDMLMIGLRV